MRGFIAQLVEHRTGIAEVTGSILVEALIFFFRFLYSNYLNWKFHIYPQFIYESFHIHYIREILVKISSEFKNVVRSGHVTDDVITMKVIKMYLTYKYLPTCNLLFPHI